MRYKKTELDNFVWFQKIVTEFRIIKNPKNEIKFLRHSQQCIVLGNIT